MKFAVLALLGLVTVGAIKVKLSTEDEDQLLFAEDIEELAQADNKQTDEQMIETEGSAYTITTNTLRGLQVDTLVLPGTNPGKTMILCHGAGKNKEWFENLDASFGLAPTSNLRIMLPTSKYVDVKRGQTPWFVIRDGYSDASYDHYWADMVEGSSDAVAGIVMDEVKRFAALYNEKPEIAAKRVFLAGMSQGAMMSLYVQLTKLDYDLGGVMLHSASFVAPLQKIIDGVTKNPMSLLKPPKENLRFLVYHGAEDDHFDKAETIAGYGTLFQALGISQAIKGTVIVPKIGHDFSPVGSKAFIKWAEDSKL